MADNLYTAYNVALQNIAEALLGGVSQQALVKQSASDFDSDWQDLTLSNVSDIDLTTPPEDGQALVFDETLGVWIPSNVAAGGGGGGSGVVGWEELAYHDVAIDGTSSGVIVDVTSYSEVMVTFSEVVLASTGWRCVQVSVDGGSTWLTASSDYSTISASGTLSNETAIYSHGSSTTAARTAYAILRGLDSTRSPKQADSPARSPQIIVNASPITHIRAIGWSSGSVIDMTAGKIIVQGQPIAVAGGASSEWANLTFNPSGTAKWNPGSGTPTFYPSNETITLAAGDLFEVELVGKRINGSVFALAISSDGETAYQSIRQSDDNWVYYRYTTAAGSATLLSGGTMSINATLTEYITHLVLVADSSVPDSQVTTTTGTTGVVKTGTIAANLVPLDSAPVTVWVAADALSDISYCRYRKLPA